MKRISKKKALLGLASALTTCDAHNDEKNSNHLFVVNLAYVLWQIYRTNGKIDTMDVFSVERCISSL